MWTICALVIPDPLALYWRWWGPYVNSHWQTDAVSHLTYYPIDYSEVGKIDAESKLFVPRNFFVKDDFGKLKVDKYSNRLVSPSCYQAKYAAKKIVENIYAVRLYVDDPDEEMSPCLVTPSTKNRN